MNLTPSTVATVSPLTNLGPFGVWITWPCTNSRSVSSPSVLMNWPAWKTALLAFPLPPEAAPEGTTMPGMNWNLPFSPLI